MVIKTKKNYLWKPFAALCFATCSGNISFAQIHIPFSNQYQWLSLAKEQSSQEIFSSAQFSAQLHYQKNTAQYLNGNLHLDIEQAIFESVKSGLVIDDANAELLAKDIIKNTTDPNFKERTALSLGQYYFQKKNWLTAIQFYEQAGIANLNNIEVANTKFQIAYCYFNTLQFDKAESNFLAIKDLQGPYQNAALYYHGLLAYNKGNYKEALSSFEKIENVAAYQNVVPYYIAEIFYFEGAREKAFLKAKKIIAGTEKSFYDKEAHLLAAQCLYEGQKYKEALPYFEYYYNKVDKIRKQDAYKMAYSYYATSQWQKAIEPFKQLSTVQDVLGQTAMYYLGDCYLKAKDKKSAKNAFSIAADMTFNAAIKESALLLSGKLALELGYSNEGSNQLKKLFAEYPNTQYKTEASNILSEQLLKANNFSEAYQLLSQANAPSRGLLQKSAYGYALQKMQQNNWTDAERLLDESLRNNEYEAYGAAAYFWKAEIDYRNKNYSEAIKNGNEFLLKNNSEVIVVCPEASAQNALMTMGYASLKNEKFAEARGYFAQAQNKQINKQYSEKLAADATLREADAAFLQKDFAKASELYTKTIAQKGSETDYALFQKSTLLGLQGRSGEQADMLMQIVAQKNPESKYKYEAHYALGDLYLDANKFEDAINNFSKVTEQTAKHLSIKALMKTAFAYQEANNDEKAIAIYKKIIFDYPNSDQKTAVLDALKNLYVGNNKPSEYLQLLKENNIETTDNASLDSVFYAAAEAQYIANNYAKAISGMANYLEKFPQGIFIIKAHFYKAESHFANKEFEAALKEYDTVLQSTWSDFTEPAAKKAATLAMTQNNFQKAKEYYSVLRDNAIGKDNLKVAYKGLMLTSKKLNLINESNEYADVLLSLPDLDDASKNEAIIIKANAVKIAGKYDEAKAYFEQLVASKNIEIAAEANYNLAEILLLENKITEAEKATNKAIQQTTSSSYWNTKSYMLMADVFVAQKDYFNAKATLQSIVKNVKIDSLRKEAAAKLEQVKTLEKGKSKLSEG